MGLFPQCVVTKFLDASSENEMKEAAFQLLSAFFESTNAQKVECFDHSYSAIEAASRLSGQMARKPSRDPVFEMMSRQNENRDRGYFQEDIGGAFSVCNGKDSQSRWMFLLNRKQIPFFYLWTNHGEGFHPQRLWGEVFFERGIADVVWLDGVFGIGRPKCYGNNADQYLFRKGQRLLFTVPLMSIPNRETATQLSCDFRRKCHDVYERQKMIIGDAAILAAWHSKKMRSIKAFDKALVDEMGLEKLTMTLNAMGITIDQWLAE